MVPLKIVSNVSRFKPALNLNRVLADFGGFKPRLKFFKFHLLKCQTKSQIFYSTLPPLTSQGEGGGRVNLKNKNPWGIVLTHFPSHLADSKFLLLITRGRHRGSNSLNSISGHIITDRAQYFCEALHDPREGLWMIKISKMCVKKFLFL